MNNAEEIILSVYRKIHGSIFNPKTPGEKKCIHKTIYLLQEMGVICGDFDFFWHVHGPYSHQLHGLLLDMENEYSNEMDFKVDITERFSKESMNKLDNLRDVFKTADSTDYNSQDWCEVLGSLHFIKKYKLGYEDDDVIVATLEKEKSHLNKHEYNTLAMEILNRNFFNC